jgi:hypothetical protein
MKPSLWVCKKLGNEFLIHDHQKKGKTCFKKQGVYGMEYPFLMQSHKRQDVANGGMARTTREGGGVTMQASPGIQ